MSGITWNIWTYCNRLLTFSIYDRKICVSSTVLEKTKFNFGGNKKYPIHKYCSYCGCERFTEKQINILSNPETKYCDIVDDPELKYITTKNINPIICNKDNCLLGLYNLSSISIIGYDINDIMNHSVYSFNSTLREILNV